MVRDIVTMTGKIENSSGFYIGYGCHNNIHLEEAARDLADFYSEFTGSPTTIRGPFRRDPRRKVVPTNPYFYIERQEGNPDLLIEPGTLMEDREDNPVSEGFSIDEGGACMGIREFHKFILDRFFPLE